MNSFIIFSLLYLIILYSTILISKKFLFFDIPNSRKIHNTKIINTSGLSLYIFVLFIVSIKEYSYEVELIISYGIFLVLCGFYDDRTSMKASIKLICILTPTIFLIINGFVVSDLGDYEFIGTIHLGKLSVFFTLLCVGLLVNSYNYVDGVDGLLISLSIAALLYIFFLSQNKDVDDLLLLFLIPLIINLIFNLLPKSTNLKMFSGDCGSLFLGFFISFLIIYAYKYEKIHPSFLIWTCWYPVYDFLFVTIKRFLNKESFYKPDNKHFHHSILKYFKNNHIKTLVLINTINMVVLMIGYLVTVNFGKIYSLALFIILFLALWMIRDKLNYKKNS
tara:strand:+ start:2086 stop:3087 length:1002 start_codon:yes stop_codon:yes gene_type:complete